MSSSNAQPAPPAVNFATEWLDEDGVVCPKNVDYATQCPKGHPLVPFAGTGAGDSPAQAQQPLMCRVCHGCAQREQAPQWRVCSVAGCCHEYAVCFGCSSALRDAPTAGAAGDDFPMLGVTLVFLQWLMSRLVLGRLTTEQAAQIYIRPRTCLRRGSVTDELTAQADSMHYVGAATWFVSHTWSNALADTLEAIIRFFDGRDDAATACVWLDFLTTPQHAIAGPSKDSSWYMGVFRSNIARIGGVLLVVDVWDNPTALKRAWCVLELHAIATRMEEGGGRFAVAMTAQEKQRFLTGIRGDPGQYYSMLGRVNAEGSECSRAADRDSIHQGIRSSVGFGKLGRMVFQVLEGWMEGELRAQVAAELEAGREAEAMDWNRVLGTVLGQQGRHDEALLLFEKVLDVLGRVLPEDDPKIGTAMNNLAATYSDLGRHEDALVLKERVLEFRRRVLPENHPDIGSAMNNLAVTYSDLGRHEDALVLKERVLEFRRRVLPENHPDIGTAMNNLANTYSALGRHEDALVLKERVLEFRRRVLPENHPDIGLSLYNLSLSFEQAGDLLRAMASAREALRIFQAALPPSHPHVAAAQRRVGDIERAIQKLALKQ